MITTMTITLNHPKQAGTSAILFKILNIATSPDLLGHEVTGTMKPTTSQAYIWASKLAQGYVGNTDPIK